MEMNGGRSVSYLARTPCVPSFCTLFNRVGNRRAFRLPGEGGDHFHCAVEPSPGHIWCRIKEKGPKRRNLESAPPFRVQETVLLVNRATPAIFVIFVVSQGLSSKTLVLLVRMQIRHFRRFRQNPLFLAGQKHGLPKAPFLGPQSLGKSTDNGFVNLGGWGWGSEFGCYLCRIFQ